MPDAHFISADLARVHDRTERNDCRLLTTLAWGDPVVFRADAAFAKPEIYTALEERGVNYAIRLPANECLEQDIAELLTRPVGRPSRKPVKMTRLSCHRFRSNEVRPCWLLSAESHLTRRLFGAMVRRIAALMPAG
jgi:hypothetical protein